MASRLIALSVFILMALVSVSAWAEKKSVTYTTKMGPVLSRTATNPGARAGHELVQQVRQDMTSSSDQDWDGTALTNSSQSDLTAGSGTIAGYAVRTHKNGDQTFYKFQGKVAAVGEGPSRQTTGEGTVELIGGTGKFAKARGTGTWSSAKGQLTIKLDLEY